MSSAVVASRGRLRQAEGHRAETRNGPDSERDLAREKYDKSLSPSD